MCNYTATPKALGCNCLKDTKGYACVRRAGRYTNFGDGTVFYKISRYK